ncbi:hypothetical protein QYE76_008127 [Lolium multiflorum]|uniref:Peptidase A1 domain-containing protein n=1 Tax=Lolium multiflorum TaxID=4521 RepID=A0AAD8QLH7_LOLMU|nr:hypothetical protein QYE76_008127 [Lolium multiflorum]
MLMAPPPLLSLSALLLLLAASASNAAAKPVQTQSLLATPLSPERSSARPELARDDDKDLFADTLAAAEDAAAASTVSFSVVHRDDFAVDTTAAELLAHRLERDGKRASGISAAAGAANTTRGGGGSGGVSAPVVSGLAQGSGEYFTKIGVGTPATPALMVLDTGSDVVWLQCAPCRRCYDQSGPVFDPRRSKSYGALDCAAPLCRRLDSGGCDLRRRACIYQVAYGDGSVTAGDFATETLTFAGGARVARVAVGCGHDNEGLFVAAAGLLGLGRGSLSFPAQISRRYGRSFSYCLVDRTSSATPATSRASTVTFGSAALASTVASSFTPMVKNPRMETFYYVQLAGISVGGARVPGVANSDLRLDPSSGRGGVIVDSGTSVTRLARPAYSALRDAFRAAAAGLRLSPGGFSLFDTCYDLSGRKVVKVPTVSMHFAGGAEASLPPENYLIPVDSKGTFCFAFAGTDGGVSIIGNIQQQGFRVVFDGDGQRVAFVPKGC